MAVGTYTLTLVSSLAPYSWNCNYNINLNILADSCSSAIISIIPSIDPNTTPIIFDINPGTSVQEFTFTIDVKPVSCATFFSFTNADSTSVDYSVFTLTGTGTGPYTFSIATTDYLKTNLPYSL